jgi:hypothetical protein
MKTSHPNSHGCKIRTLKRMCRLLHDAGSSKYCLHSECLRMRIKQLSVRCSHAMKPIGELSSAQRTKATPFRSVFLSRNIQICRVTSFRPLAIRSEVSPAFCQWSQLIDIQACCQIFVASRLSFSSERTDIVLESCYLGRFRTKHWWRM